MVSKEEIHCTPQKIRKKCKKTGGEKREEGSSVSFNETRLLFRKRK